ncbi:MAG: M48 family metallopeptidase [Lachnospiraceae bacterium]|nr:M48 family metallopeptidase [Lachnospiraceae bacterium]
MFDYQLIRSKRKTIAIQVTRDGKVVVRAPLFSTDRQIAKFIEEHEDWVTEKLGEAENDDRISSLDFTPAEIRVYKKRAQGIISRRVAHYAGIMDVDYNRITIRDQKSRWGSCSEGKNLNFSWRLILMPIEVMDYVVVHELAHLKQMNHSQAFWEEVEKILPNYKEQRKWLKENG